uniref:Uncharacterized protein n=1 Tax=Anguilla anguilla TaxID=7936 RepID=A0A0E9RC76_ANGAN
MGTSLINTLTCTATLSSPFPLPGDFKDSLTR